MIILKTTGTIFQDMKEAKLVMGRKRWVKHLKSDEIEFVFNEDRKNKQLI